MWKVVDFQRDSGRRPVVLEPARYSSVSLLSESEEGILSEELPWRDFHRKAGYDLANEHGRARSTADQPVAANGNFTHSNARTYATTDKCSEREMISPRKLIRSTRSLWD